MNLPNKLTILRILLVPVFLIFLMAPLGLGVLGRYIALGIFIAASLTDCLDGYIARRYNLVTNFGKFMDPLADKLLCVSAMIALTAVSDAVVKLNVIVVIIIIAREFAVTGLRTIAAEKNVVIAASPWGKLKTIFQMIMIIILLLNIDNGIMAVLAKCVIAIAVILTIVSAADYFYKNRKALKE